jgi:hypothetical protein
MNLILRYRPTHELICPCAVHEGVWGSLYIAPPFLNPGAIWKRAVSFTPRPLLYSGKQSPVPLKQEFVDSLKFERHINRR